MTEPRCVPVAGLEADRMDDTRYWARSWLINLVTHGVPEHPGSPRTVVLHNLHWATLTRADVLVQLRELRRPVVDGVPKHGRYAVVYERAWDGRDAVWMEAAEYRYGRFGDRLVLVQPVRRGPARRLEAVGGPVELSAAQVPAQRGRPRALSHSSTGLVAGALVGVLTIGALCAVLLARHEDAGARPAPGQSGLAQPAPAPPLPEAPPPAAPPVPAPGPSAAGTPVPAPGPSAAPPGADQADASGDLGLSVPISRPRCEGGFGVFIAAAVRPDAYRSEVADALSRHTGASYLLAEQACSSLRGRTAAGHSIYAVYYGPYPTLRAACAARSSLGGANYVRRLDNSSPAGHALRC
ncbi:MAG: hypothetical protein ACT4O0_02550 [Pseudonocardia sp.]